MPSSLFTDTALENLDAIIAAKGELIKKALGITALPILREDGKICFPWFPGDASPEEIKAYDNFICKLCEMARTQKRITAKEKEVSYTNGKADTVAKLLPVYDNLERALNQPTEDAAYKKGVEMTMTELQKIFEGLGVEVFGNVGDGFDPNLHNAVMHTEDESLGENTVSMVFQKGFKLGDKVIRFAMVQVAN